MSMNVRSDSLAAPSPWIVSSRWDLSWLTLSALLVPLPILLHSFRIGPLGIDALVTLLIGVLLEDAGDRERSAASGPLVSHRRAKHLEACRVERSEGSCHAGPP